VSAEGAALAALQTAAYERASPSMRTGWPEEQALGAAGFEDLMRRNRYAVLATARPDGRAHATPIAYTVRNGAFWIGTVEGVRLRNLRARQWAALVVMEGQRDEGEPPELGPPHRVFTAEGPVVLHEGRAFATALRPLREQWVARHGHEPDWAVALIELRPARVFSHAAG
jgi:Pyridoxamine 5'-phosphate oxidase